MSQDGVDVPTGRQHIFQLQGFKAHITEVLGLYQPGYNAPADVTAGAAKRSGYLKGYKSGDDKGRIFINCIPRANTGVAWDAVWKKNTQYIDLTVEVRPLTLNAPADARIVWEWSDPDDPSNEQYHMRLDAGRIVDSNDYSSTGKIGTTPNDNAGKRDYPSVDGGTGFIYQEIAPYAMTPQAGTNRCETSIQNHISKVRLHCPNVGGDNVKISVGFKSARLKQQAEHDDQTGIMTLWKRIDVEHVHMSGAQDLSPLVSNVPPCFEPAFVQMDFTPARSVPDKPFMSVRSNDLETQSSRYVQGSSAGGVFEHAGKPGWFLLVAANQAVEEIGTAASRELYHGPARVSQISYSGGEKGEGLIVPASFHSDISYVILEEGGKSILFTVSSTDARTPGPGQSLIHLDPIDYQSDFEAGTGLIGSAGHGGAYNRTDNYYPRHKFSQPGGGWTPGGYGFGPTVQVRVYSPGSYATAGISPTNSQGSNDYFAGKTIIFTRHGAYTSWDAEAQKDIISTIAHEFGHAFGFPHKCGFYTFENPPHYSCAMNYSVTWLYRPGTRTVQRFVTGEAGRNFCGPHIHGIRSVHLEDNPTLWTWG